MRVTWVKQHMEGNHTSPSQQEFCLVLGREILESGSEKGIEPITQARGYGRIKAEDTTIPQKSENMYSGKKQDNRVTQGEICGESGQDKA